MTRERECYVFNVKCPPLTQEFEHYAKAGGAVCTGVESSRCRASLEEMGHEGGA